MGFWIHCYSCMMELCHGAVFSVSTLTLSNTCCQSSATLIYCYTFGFVAIIFLLCHSFKIHAPIG